MALPKRKGKHSACSQASSNPDLRNFHPWLPLYADTMQHRPCSTHTQSYPPTRPSKSTSILSVKVSLNQPLLQLGWLCQSIPARKIRWKSASPPAKRESSPGWAWPSSSCWLEVQEPFCHHEDKATN